MISIIVTAEYTIEEYINGVVQDCGISSTLAMEIPQSGSEILISWLHLAVTLHEQEQSETA